MNVKQKKIFLTTIIVIALMGIFPPWHFLFESIGVSQNMGYGFIASPPQFTTAGGGSLACEINVKILLVQWAVMAILGGGLVYYNKQD